MHVPKPVCDQCVCAHGMCKSNIGIELFTEDHPIWVGPL